MTDQCGPLRRKNTKSQNGSSDGFWPCDTGTLGDHSSDRARPRRWSNEYVTSVVDVICRDKCWKEPTLQFSGHWPFANVSQKIPATPWASTIFRFPKNKMEWRQSVVFIFGGGECPGSETQTVRSWCNWILDRSNFVVQLNYFTFQLVLHIRFNKGSGILYFISKMVHIKYLLLLNGKSCHEVAAACFLFFLFFVIWIVFSHKSNAI